MIWPHSKEMKAYRCFFEPASNNDSYWYMQFEHHQHHGPQMDTILGRMLTIPNCFISCFGFPNEYYARGFKTKNLCAFSSVSTASALIIPGDVYKSYAHHNVSCIHTYVCACMCGRIFACVCVRSWGSPPRTHAHTG